LTGGTVGVPTAFLDPIPERFFFKNKNKKEQRKK
jgi:hypothetical protein